MSFTGSKAKIAQFFKLCGVAVATDYLIGHRDLNYATQNLASAAPVLANQHKGDLLWRDPVCLLAFTDSELIFTYDGLMINPQRAAERAVHIPLSQVRDFNVNPEMEGMNVQFGTSSEQYKIMVNTKDNAQCLTKLQDGELAPTLTHLPNSQDA
ncbi:hypothetical protein [Lacticaseibacillus hulanensis]|jgi:hypothetical protein|uniref:hypothetical protein n=1 Tax=Lacticaseibacillus hulanensis TaxID=2493111 RepID=UPI000FDC419F|nr:hypothetical protein [Lacticaseibacillus hulanensis]